ncbi:C40 family peptidase [Nocardia sp. NPDC052566]|uniref:C40 family peptidase n=1 Tax=Nocardia sp. NPDC052566 TaxID=3364330 RepID=UPI0037C8AB6A
MAFLRAFLRRNIWRIVVGAALAVGAGALMALAAGQASAQQVTVPGIGTFELPGGLSIPAGIPGIELPAVTNVPGLVPVAPVEIPGDELPVLVDIPRGAPPAHTAPPRDSVGRSAADAALSRVGAGYSSGAVGPDAFDCSGLVQWSYQQAGRDVPRTSYEQLDTGTPVGADELQPGDLVSFYGGGHSAIYVGDGEVVHASTDGAGVMVSPMSSMPFAGARRF